MKVIIQKRSCPVSLSEPVTMRLVLPLLPCIELTVIQKGKLGDICQEAFVSIVSSFSLFDQENIASLQESVMKFVSSLVQL